MSWYVQRILGMIVFFISSYFKFTSLPMLRSFYILWNIKNHLAVLFAVVGWWTFGVQWNPPCSKHCLSRDLTNLRHTTTLPHYFVQWGPGYSAEGETHHYKVSVIKFVQTKDKYISQVWFESCFFFPTPLNNYSTSYSDILLLFGFITTFWSVCSAFSVVWDESFSLFQILRLESEEWAAPVQMW